MALEVLRLWQHVRWAIFSAILPTAKWIIAIHPNFVQGLATCLGHIQTEAHSFWGANAVVYSLFSYRPYSEYSCFWRSFTYIYIDIYCIYILYTVYIYYILYIYILYTVYIYILYIYIYVNIDSLRSSWKGFNALNEMWHHVATWSSESVEKSPASNVSHSLAPPLLTSEGQVWMRMRRQAD